MRKNRFISFLLALLLSLTMAKAQGVVICTENQDMAYIGPAIQFPSITKKIDTVRYVLNYDFAIKLDVKDTTLYHDELILEIGNTNTKTYSENRYRSDSTALVLAKKGHRNYPTYQGYTSLEKHLLIKRICLNGLGRLAKSIRRF